MTLSKVLNAFSESLEDFLIDKIEGNIKEHLEKKSELFLNDTKAPSLIPEIMTRYIIDFLKQGLGSEKYFAFKYMASDYSRLLPAMIDNKVTSPDILKLVSLGYANYVYCLFYDCVTDSTDYSQSMKDKSKTQVTDSFILLKGILGVFQTQYNTNEVERLTYIANTSKSVYDVSIDNLKNDQPNDTYIQSLTEQDLKFIKISIMSVLCSTILVECLSNTLSEIDSIIASSDFSSILDDSIKLSNPNNRNSVSMPNFLNKATTQLNNIFNLLKKYTPT